MSRKPKTVSKPALPQSHLCRIDALGLTTISYSRDAVLVQLPDGDTRAEWLPRDLIGTDGKTAIIHRNANDGNYSIDGWEPWHDGMFGGRYESIHSALHWVEVARDVRAGKRDNFQGA